MKRVDDTLIELEIVPGTVITILKGLVSDIIRTAAVEQTVIAEMGNYPE